MKKRVYLAGPIAGLNHEQATYNWRKEVYEKLSGEHWVSSNDSSMHSVIVDCYSPMRGKKFLAEMMGDNKLGTHAYHQQPISTPNAIVGRDREDVRRADLIFMNLMGAKERSIGTIVEMGWADAFRVPVLLCMEKEGNIHEHLFMRQMATYVVDNITDGIFIAKHFLLPGLD